MRRSDPKRPGQTWIVSLAMTVGDGRPSLGRLRRPAAPCVGAGNPQEVPPAILTLSSQGSRNVPATVVRLVRAARGRVRRKLSPVRFGSLRVRKHRFNAQRLSICE